MKGRAGQRPGVWFLSVLFSTPACWNAGARPGGLFGAKASSVSGKLGSNRRGIEAPSPWSSTVAGQVRTGEDFNDEVCVCDCVAASSRPTHRGTTGTIPSPFGQRLARPPLPDTVRRDFPSTRTFLFIVIKEAVSL
uniref:Putative secreted protein n=1 Tax=Ixodes scapularis TaxID=6945 RepID=A0A4D5RZC6_IXOSC